MSSSNSYRFGQDDEWVAANFTNVAEILSVGYPQWVDAQVGTGLTNGLYKLTETSRFQVDSCVRENFTNIFA